MFLSNLLSIEANTFIARMLLATSFSALIVTVLPARDTYVTLQNNQLCMYV